MGDTGGDTGADQDRREAAEGRELRVLLERAAPRLPSPEGRLEQVRERVVRGRRRRRTAGAAAAAVTGLVLAGALLPGVLRGGPEQVLPAATVPGPVPTVPGPVPTADASESTARDRSGETPPPDGAYVSFPHLRGLTLRPPSRWYTVDLPPDGPSGAPARGFVSSRPLTPYDTACPVERRSDCPPLRTLGPGGALVTLVEQGSGTPATTVGDRSEPHPLAKPSRACRQIGGTREYSALLSGVVDASDGATVSPGTEEPVSVDLVVAVSLCAAGDAPGSVEAVHTMISGADFTAGSAPVTPSASAWNTK
ncbi:hypothetical protein ACIBJC_33990 [Streptomyces sp. NPDC050509]|uniref:hypothetical protein n=1 Tax=Streptomyces sp. NPDC050509 TaxID=3365620 RepID=UPI0037BAC6BD